MLEILIAKGRKWYAKYYDSAIDIASAEFGTLCEIAERNNVFLSVGIIEKSGATLYCSAVLIGRDGSLLSNHRKVSCRKSWFRNRLTNPIWTVDSYCSRAVGMGSRRG